MALINKFYHCLTLTIILFSCKSGIDSKYPLEKRYWGPEEYDKVIYTIRYKTLDSERKPEFSNPETAPVIRKLVDPQNFLVVLQDENLGISHRNKQAEKFFNEWRNLPKAYSQMDRQDKFVYGMELIESYKFGLHLQLYYFQLGNENVVNNADNPEAQSVKKVLRSNVNAIFGNYNNFLDYVNNESSFSDEEIIAFAEGIDKYFPMLFETFPDGNKGVIRNKAELMAKKATNATLKTSLVNLLALIDSDRQE